VQIKFIDNEIIVKHYCFSSPTTSSKTEDIPSSMYYFCLKKKLALLVDEDSYGNSVASYKRIMIRKDVLYIDYDRGEGFEKAGPMAQDKYQLIRLEEAL